MRRRLTSEADADITRILRQTKKLFGADRVLAYAEIIERGIDMIAENPSRPTCHARGDIRFGVKSFHLELVRNRRKSASHFVYFTEQLAPDGETEVVVIGVLHERMEPKRKLGKALRRLENDGSDISLTPGKR